MIGLDIIGLIGFIFYCAFMQTYISSYFALMLLLLISNTWESTPKGIGMYEEGDDVKKVMKIKDFLRFYNSNQKENLDIKASVDNES